MTVAGIYVTGTDTGVGKSLVSAALLHACRDRGLYAVGMKPVASGCVLTGRGWRNADALALQRASRPRPCYADLNPYPLPEPTAPELAARAAGVDVSLQVLVDAYGRLAGRAGRVVVEGVGGWLAPLDAGLEQSELVRRLGLSVVLVVGLRLGCLNHARLTARAVQADGCRLAGWVACATEPGFDPDGCYLPMLRRELQAPCFGHVPFQPAPVRPARVAQLLEMDTLFPT